MSGTRFISALHDDEAGRGAQRVLPVRTVTRFHRNDRGNMVMLLLFTVFILWVLSGLIWNTGQTVSSKIENQTAADTAAYTAAVWNARTVNAVTGLNRQIVRASSAEAVALAMPLTTVWLVGNWTAHIAMRVGQGPPGWVILATEAPAIFAEIVATSEFMITSIIDVLPEWWNGQLRDRINEIVAMEKAIIKATPVLIEEDLKWLSEKYYPNVEIKLYQPFKHADAVSLHTDGNKVDKILPPLKESDYFGLLVPSLIQLFRDLYSQEGWFRYGSMGLTHARQYGRGHIGWPLMGVVCQFIVPLLVDDHYELVNTNTASLLHPMPSTGDGATLGDQQKYFSVLAVSRGTGGSGHYMMTGIFDRPGFASGGPDDISVCYAQAECFNPISSMFEDTFLDTILSILPWQTNSTWGWQWQARLARARTLDEYLKKQESTTEFGRFTNQHGGGSVDGINLH